MSKLYVCEEYETPNEEGYRRICSIEEHDRQISAEAIEEYRQCLLKDLIPLKDKYFEIARGTAMPERYTHLKRMDTVDMIIETVNLKAEALKE